VLQEVLTKPGTPAGKCPAGYTAVTGPVTSAAGTTPSAALCSRPLGQPATFGDAAISLSPQNNNSGGYQLLVTLPRADVPALTAITTKAVEAKSQLAIIVAGQTWTIPVAEAPLTAGQFIIALPTKTLAQQLQHILTPPT
jgi:hypothetical protein